MSHHLIPNRFETLEQRGLVTNLCIPHMQTMLMCCFFLNQMKFQSGEKSLENTPQRLHLTDFVLIRQILLGLVNICYPVIALDRGGPCTSETLCSSHGLDAEIKLEVASFFHIIGGCVGKTGRVCRSSGAKQASGERFDTSVCRRHRLNGPSYQPAQISKRGHMYKGIKYGLCLL